MASERSDMDHLDAVALWRSLKSYLKVDIEVVAPESPKPESPVNVKVTVTNIAPSGPDLPDIVFENVSGRSGTLSSGQSFSRDYECSFHELAAMDWAVEAVVSRQRFFSVRQMATAPTSLTRPTILAYVRAFNEIPIHSPLESLKKATFMPGPRTTLAEMQALTAAAASSKGQIETLGRRLGEIQPKPGGQARAHLEGVWQYLTSVKDVCNQFGAALASTKDEEIAAAGRALQALEGEASKVNLVTEELMRRHNISNDEGNFTQSS